MVSPPDPAASVRPWVASYPPGVPPTYRLPKVRLPRLLEDAARDFPEHTAVEFGRRQLTYVQLQEHVADLAARLPRLSDADGEPSLEGVHVLVRLPDGLAGPIVLFALWRAGAIPVPVPTNAPRQQLEKLVTRLGITGAIGDGRLLRRAALPGLRFAIELRGDEWDPSGRGKLLRRLPAVPTPFGRRRRGRGSASGDATAVTAATADATADATDVGDAAGGTGHLDAAPATARTDALHTSIAALLADGTAHRPLARPVVDPEAPAMVVVRMDADEPAITQHTHRTLLATAFQSRLWVPDVQAGRERVLIAEPVNDIVGSAVGLLSAVLSGATSILVDQADPPLARVVEQGQPTLMIARVARLAELVHDTDGRRRDLTSLRVCLAVGEGLRPNEAQELEGRTTGARIRPLRGCGDAAPIAHGQPVYGRVVPTTIGLPVTSTLALVVDPDDLGEVRDPDQPGRLLLHGPQVAPRTDDADVIDGWLVTDLIARVDEHGWFTVIGHEAEVVDVGGRSRSPGRIAAEIRRHTTVRDAEVVEVDGELIAAVVAARRRSPDPVLLRQGLAVHLDAWAMPDGIVVVDELPQLGDAAGNLDSERLQALIRDARRPATVHTEDREDAEEDDPSVDPPAAGRTT